MLDTALNIFRRASGAAMLLCVVLYILTDFILHSRPASTAGSASTLPITQHQVLAFALLMLWLATLAALGWKLVRQGHNSAWMHSLIGLIAYIGLIMMAFGSIPHFPLPTTWFMTWAWYTFFVVPAVQLMELCLSGQ